MTPSREAQRIIQFVNQRLSKPLAFVRIEKTEGSTYRKPGALKVISLDDQEACGLISGGCLEGEIIEKANQMQSENVQHTFSTLSEEDRLFGYSIGCQGVLHLSFEKKSFDQPISYIDLGFEKPLPKIFIVGAGPDTEPLTELLEWTGWDYEVFKRKSDEFDDYFKKLNFGDNTALLLMSHNYPVDLQVLSQVVDKNIPYIGILGPEARKEKMLEDLPKLHDVSWPKETLHLLHGPMGILGMGRGEDAVALSIVSDLQKTFYGDNQ